MDDSFGNLVYIIIALVAFAISALGKKKKKQAQRTNVNIKSTTSGKESSAFSFNNIEKLIKEEIGLKDQNSINDPYETEFIQEEKPVEEVLDTVPEEILDNKAQQPFSIEYADTKEVFSDFIENSDLSKKESSEEFNLDDFNLQKAVIYSEIINRKKY